MVPESHWDDLVGRCIRRACQRTPLGPRGERHDVVLRKGDVREPSHTRIKGSSSPLALALTKGEQPTLQANREPRPLFESPRAGKKAGSFRRERAACFSLFHSPLGPRVDPEVRRNGTTGESSAGHTWAKMTDFGRGTRTSFLPSGFLLSGDKWFMKKSAFYGVRSGGSVHSGRLRTGALFQLSGRRGEGRDEVRTVSGGSTA